VKATTEKYYPSNVPDTPAGLIQYLYDELWRISTAINAAPAAVSVEQAGAAAPVAPGGIESRLFEGTIPYYDLPGGGWVTNLGEWVVPADGIYQFTTSIKVQPFGGGNKDYSIVLRVYVNDVQIQSGGSTGDDAHPHYAVLANAAQLLSNDRVRTTLTIDHDNFTGDGIYDAVMSITSAVLT